MEILKLIQKNILILATLCLMHGMIALETYELNPIESISETELTAPSSMIDLAQEQSWWNNGMISNTYNKVKNQLLDYISAHPEVASSVAIGLISTLGPIAVNAAFRYLQPKKRGVVTKGSGALAGALGAQAPKNKSRKKEPEKKPSKKDQWNLNKTYDIFRGWINPTEQSSPKKIEENKAADILWGR